MSVKDFALIVGICLIWAASNIISKILISTYEVPPLLYAALRFVVAAAISFPWLLPAPRPLWRTILVGMLMGAGSFGFYFIGLETASPSAAGVVSQLSLPMTTVLSVLVLGEKIHWPRRVGIALTFAGVLIVVWDPAGFSASVGLMWVVASALSGSIASVLMKQMEGVKPMKLQAWVALSSSVPLLFASAAFEPHGVQQAMASGWVFAAGVVFTAVVVSIGCHTIYYHLIQRYEATLIAPLTLMTPLGTIALGVAITHDPFGLRMIAGAALALSGVLIIAMRKSPMGVVRLWLKEQL
jgi:drug/metabolite transporter (DMT)-like permease